jgi:LmbE family N-acetylglucosaminyl deacetylase
MSHRLLRALFFLLVILARAAQAQIGPLPLDRGSNGLALALRRLPLAGRVLYVTAHPDDEDNGVLVMLSRGRGLRTGLLTLTRGDGGQNALGPELFSALGVLRTGELDALHRYDRVEQYFSAAYEFGFSFSMEDTLRRWGHEETLGDVVRVIRSFRPDVILTMPLEGSGHQHHTAAAHLALEGFRAAADPARFPEQIRAGLRPWKTQKIYQGGVGGSAQPVAGAVPLKTGTFDPLLGMSWVEFGSLARASHKSQAEGQFAARPGDFPTSPYLLVEADPRPVGVESDVLDGVDVSLTALARFVLEGAAPFLKGDLATVEADVQKADFDPRDPGRVLPAIASGLSRLRSIEEKVRALSGNSASGRDEVLERLESKEADFLAALPLAQGLSVEATAAEGDVAPGHKTTVSVRVFNQGKSDLGLDEVTLRAPLTWAVERLEGGPRLLHAGEGILAKYAVTVGADALPTQPYWRRVDSKDRYDSDVPSAATLPWARPELVASLHYTTQGVKGVLESPVVFRYLGSAETGERRKGLNVVPALSVRIAPRVGLLPLPAARTRTFDVRVKGQGVSHAVVRLEVPRGWSAVPPEAPIALSAGGEEIATRFEVHAPAVLQEGVFEVRAVATSEGQDFRTGYQTIAYRHVEERHLYSPAVASLRALEVRIRPGIRVGYVMGVGDEVPDALRELGVSVTLLSEEDLAFSDLSRYTTIVLGIRAYQARADLRSYNRRLLEYASHGGNLVVQYNRAEFNVLSPSRASTGAPSSSPFAPYPAVVTANRITDPTAPLAILVPESPLFRTPNALTVRDWEGWVQERGIQFLEAKDARYTELLSGSDPYPLNAGTKKGILVVARVGKGTWTYVGLGLFRQLAAGTPGAYRILANLVSRPFVQGP